MLNRVVLVGRLTKDPEFSMTPSGVEKATFTLAVNRQFANNQGEKEADFIYCIVWRKAAVNVNQYLSKGSLAGVDGRIQTRSYEGQDGKRVYVTEVVAESVQFLEPKGHGQSESGNSYQNQSQGQNNYQQQTNYQNQNTYQQSQQNNFSQQRQTSYQQSNQNNFIRHEEDPFANSGSGKIDITEDDLPF